MTDRRVDPESAVIGRRLKGLRVEQGLKAEEVALQLSMTAGNYAHYESGRNRLIAMDLPRFARALRVDVPTLTTRLGLAPAVANGGSPSPRQRSEDRVAEVLERHPEVSLSLAQVGPEMDEEDADMLVGFIEYVARRSAEKRRNARRS